MSELAEIAYITLQETDLTLAGIIDDKAAGNSFLGFQIKDTTLLKTISEHSIVVITEIDDSNFIKNLLNDSDFTDDRIINLPHLL